MAVDFFYFPTGHNRRAITVDFLFKLAKLSRDASIRSL